MTDEQIKAELERLGEAPLSTDESNEAARLAELLEEHAHFESPLLPVLAPVLAANDDSATASNDTASNTSIPWGRIVWLSTPLAVAAGVLLMFSVRGADDAAQVFAPPSESPAPSKLPTPDPSPAQAASPAAPLQASSATAVREDSDKSAPPSRQKNLAAEEAPRAQLGANAEGKAEGKSAPPSTPAPPQDVVGSQGIGHAGAADDRSDASREFSSGAAAARRSAPGSAPESASAPSSPSPPSPPSALDLANIAAERALRAPQADCGALSLALTALERIHGRACSPSPSEAQAASCIKSTRNQASLRNSIARNCR